MQDTMEPLAAIAGEALAPAGEQELKEAVAKRMGPHRVPEEIRPALETLMLEGREWETRKACAKSRFQKAVQAGDAEEAIKEDRVVLSVMKEIDRSNKELETIVRGALPDLPTDGDIRVSVPEWVVEMDYSAAYRRAR